MISNLIAFFAVGGTWWRALLLVHGICFGPQGQGNGQRRLQPGGPTLGVQQRVHDLDGEVIMRVGGGKKHGRFWISNGTIDTASTPTLSQI